MQEQHLLPERCARDLAAFRRRSRRSARCCACCACCSWLASSCCCSSLTGPSTKTVLLAVTPQALRVLESSCMG